MTKSAAWIASASSSKSSPKRACTSWAGATSRPRTRAWAPAPGLRSPSSARSSSIGRRVWSRTLPSSASSTSSAAWSRRPSRARRSQPAATSTSHRSAAGPSSTRACSMPLSYASSTRTWPTSGSRAPSPWSIRVSRPTPSRPGRAPIRTATSRTTARSIPCAATLTGCTLDSRSSVPSCSATS